MQVMTEVLHANIFFVIASVGVVALTILACVLLYQVIKIVRSIRRIVDRVEAGSEVLAEDIENIRENLNPAKLVTFVMNLIPGMSMPRRRTRKRAKD